MANVGFTLLLNGGLNQMMFLFLFFLDFVFVSLFSL